MTGDPLRRETKRAAVPLQSVEPDGTFEGYASLFGMTDLAGDVIERGAFQRSLKRRGAGGVKMLWQHDPAEPIGAWTRIVEDGRGLYVSGRLTTEVARAREVLALMRGGALDGLSIGFRTVKARQDQRSGLRHLVEVDLWEVSVVTFPMLEGARVGLVKGSPWAVAESETATIRRAAARLRQAAL